MTFLNNGGSAVDAVEIAIKVLEDKEITNAGFGSNLTIDGAVECDATIVDHYGRSGAVGAVGCTSLLFCQNGCTLTAAGLQNPIHLARLILDHSTQPLSLRRVPPNLLVGPGATEYAAEIGMNVVHPDLLVSPSAGERYDRWKSDLHKVENSEQSESDVEGSLSKPRIEGVDHMKEQNRNIDLMPCWNESQPYSPRNTPYEANNPLGHSDKFHQPSPPTSEPSHDGVASPQKQNSADGSNGSNVGMADLAAAKLPPSDISTKHNKRKASSDLPLDQDIVYESEDPKAPPPTRSDSHDALYPAPIDSKDVARSMLKPDEITDTVGAIAVDCFGNIAAGSSSGGIGMKHRGRVGPAALVGIGTAVTPIEPRDSDKLCVATVTSGTGEHMATTMAAGMCANRLYSTSRMSKNGGAEPAEDDDEAIRSFVEKDFMGKISLLPRKAIQAHKGTTLGHPSVKHSHSAGAIGVLGVKKTTHGIYFYFAHNTDSFVRCQPVFHCENADLGIGSWVDDR